MATSRTGTSKWLRVAKQAKQAAIDAGQTKCPVCGVNMDWEYPKRPNSAEVDHIIPHSKGGQDTIENVRVICRLDNQRLGGRLNRRKRPDIETVDLDSSPIW